MRIVHPLSTVVIALLLASAVHAQEYPTNTAPANSPAPPAAAARVQSAPDMAGSPPPVTAMPKSIGAPAPGPVNPCDNAVVREHKTCNKKAN